MNTNTNFLSLQPLLFDFDIFSKNCCINLTDKEAEFASILNMICSMYDSCVYETNRKGRKGYRDYDILVIRVVMLYFKQNNIKQTISFLKSCPGLREVIGLNKIPSESVVSRRSKSLLNTLDVDAMFNKVTAEYYKDKVVCNLSIDSTPIDARETPVKPSKAKKDKDTIDALNEDAKNGDLGKYLSSLENRCSITGKRNSKGHMQWRIGYKVHLAVDDMGIPVSYYVSGAAVHDSKVAIPLLRMAHGKVPFLYALMDGGYSSSDIEDYTKKLNAVPIIDFKANRNGEKKEMDDAKKERYKARTTVERTNSELKDCFLPPKLFSRGKSSILDLKLAVLLLTMKKIRSISNTINSKETA